MKDVITVNQRWQVYMGVSSSIGWALSLGCSWILWSEISPAIIGKFEPQWEIVGSTATFEQCHELQQRFVTRKLQEGPRYEKTLSEHGVYDPNDFKIFDYTCWPETHDPRKK